MLWTPQLQWPLMAGTKSSGCAFRYVRKEDTGHGVFRSLLDHKQVSVTINQVSACAWNSKFIRLCFKLSLTRMTVISIPCFQFHQRWRLGWWQHTEMPSIPPSREVSSRGTTLLLLRCTNLSLTKIVNGLLVYTVLFLICAGMMPTGTTGISYSLLSP